MNDNHPARSGLAIVGGDDDLAHSLFFGKRSMSPHRKYAFSTFQILWIFSGKK